MPKNKRQRINKRNRERAKHWDLIATKSLLVSTPAHLYNNLQETFQKLGLTWSSQSRNRYQSALIRAVGSEACARHGFIYNGTFSGRWASCPRKFSGSLENLVAQSLSGMLSGTSMHVPPDGPSSPAIPTNKSDDSDRHK